MFLIPDGQGLICPQVQHTLSAPRSLVGTRKVLFKRELTKDQARSTCGRLADLARNSLPGPMKPGIKMSLVGMRLGLKGPLGGPC